MSTPHSSAISPSVGQQEAARILHALWTRRDRFAALPDNVRPATRRDGYAVQQAFEQVNGVSVSGWKIAATSIDGQRHINVDGPLAGRIYQDRVLPVGASVSLKDNLMHVAEIEFAFRFAHELPPRANEYSVDEVLGAVAAVHPSIEVPDSRYEDFVKVGTAQLIADNACACLFILGPSAEGWSDFDYLNEAVKISVNGQAIDPGYGRNVLSDPRVALAWLVNELSSIGISMKAGQFVTTGTCRVPVKVQPGDFVQADFGKLGQVGCSFTL